MERFIEFLALQWPLVGALMACVLLLVYHDSRRAGKTLSPREVVDMVNREQAVVIDLRDSAEFRAGHILDAVNIPTAKVEERMVELENYRERPLVLVCKLGQSAGAVGKKLTGLGFSRVFRLGGGMSEWQNMQLPVVKQ